MTSATTWPFLAALSEREAALQEWARRQGSVTRGLYEFVRFGLKQAWACLFGAILLGMIVATHLWYPHDAPLARYDALVLASLAVQAGLLLTGMEAWQEARVIPVELFRLYYTAGPDAFRKGLPGALLFARVLNRGTCRPIGRGSRGQWRSGWVLHGCPRPYQTL